MNYLSKNHRRGLDHQTLASWKGMGLLAVITAILFLIPGFAMAQVPVVDAGPDQTIYLGDTAAGARDSPKTSDLLLETLMAEAQV